MPNEMTHTTTFSTKTILWRLVIWANFGEEGGVAVILVLSAYSYAY
jgi:hypothetical protein